MWPERSPNPWLKCKTVNFIVSLTTDHQRIPSTLWFVISLTSLVSVFAQCLFEEQLLALREQLAITTELRGKSPSSKEVQHPRDGSVPALVEENKCLSGQVSP